MVDTWLAKDRAVIAGNNKGYLRPVCLRISPDELITKQLNLTLLFFVGYSV
jgi:hypothetical protein